jgi:N-acetylglutamate synthase-like GNAT family acetyltransferase
MAQPPDAEALKGLINAAFQKAEAFFIDRNRVDTETVRSLLEKGKFLVAEDDGTFLACVYLERRGERAYLGLLSVDPTLQRGGIGSKMMIAAEEHCVDMACRFVDLRIVNLRTENQAFYSRRGYIETGTEPFPADLNTKLPCHFVNMSKQLW